MVYGTGIPIQDKPRSKNHDPSSGMYTRALVDTTAWMKRSKALRMVYWATLLLLAVCLSQQVAMADTPAGVRQLMRSPATLFDLGIWRLDLLMKTVARALESHSTHPVQQRPSLSGQAEYDPRRNEIVLKVHAIHWKEPSPTVNRCKATWYRVRNQVFWQEGIPFRPQTADRNATTLLLRQFSHYAIEPRITPRDLQQDLLRLTRLAITARGQKEGFLECSAPLVGGAFRVVDAGG